MKQLLTLLMLAGSVAAMAQRPVDTIISAFKNPQSKEVLVAAHRGDWRNAPENSLAAIRYAIAMGVDIIEIDVQKTADGVLVLMHDETIDRTTTGKGRVQDVTFAYLKTLYLRNGAGVPTTHRIPTLEEAMLEMKGKVMVNLDKSYRYMDETYAVLEKTGTVDHGIFKGEAALSALKAEHGAVIVKALYMPIINLDKSDAAATLHEYQYQLHAAAFEFIFKSDTASILSNLPKKDCRIWVNALWGSLNGGHYDDMAFDDGNLKDSWDWLVAKGFTIIQTDRPAAMLGYLRRKGLHR
ncbi:glycerophosphodiester phosphodiesterase family protein [Chitinophaga sp.]|uniref:glycerophosphodiester phosphodiesterase family protein n=1 Tax=Chitinophaga sp. TaxID=1869181 RepID=UPI0031E40BAC